jgi:hypothetical protein
MKPFTISKYLFFTLLISMVMYSCGDDDSPPPPGVDCNVTGPSFTFATTESACGQDDGTITLTITGGNGNLAVTIDPQPIDVEFANNTFTNVEPGSYDIEVTDSDNCSTIENVVVDFASGTVSYMDDLEPIVQSRCAVTGCHVAGTGLPDFTIFSEFQARANNDPGGIRQRVKTDDMPRTGNPLTAEQKIALFCWIDDGAQDN